MPKRVLDTSKLLNHWKRYRPASGVRTTQGAEDWARRLIEIEQTDAIVTPVELELLAGDLNQGDRALTTAYLKPFRVIDEGRILSQDWRETRRLVQRIWPQPSPRRRGLVDCLIRAIASRLNHDLVTDDRGIPPA